MSGWLYGRNQRVRRFLVLLGISNTILILYLKYIFYRCGIILLVIPYRVLIWSLSFVSRPLEKRFLTFKNTFGDRLFLVLGGFTCDRRWWMVLENCDGRWWIVIEKRLFWSCSKFCKVKFRWYKSREFSSLLLLFEKNGKILLKFEIWEILDKKAA